MRTSYKVVSPARTTPKRNLFRIGFVVCSTDKTAPADFDNDGWPDIFVACDSIPHVSRTAAESSRHLSMHCFGVNGSGYCSCSIT